VKMDMIWNQNRMMNLLGSLFALVKVRVGFFDLEGREILAYPSGRTEYCNMIRACAAGDEACKYCDRQAFHRAAKQKGPYIYQCHAGLTEMVAPIITSEEERIGYLMIGQVRPPGNPNEVQLENVSRNAGRLHINPEKLRAAYLNLAAIKTDQVRACANILQALATYVWLDNYIRLQNEPLSDKVKTYIYKNCNKSLSLTMLAGRFKVGKTTLCKSIKKDCHVTVNELVRSIRIDKAKQLLQAGELPVSAVAEEVGIMDYNYFAKVFKEEIGVPPSIYRKLCEGEYLYRNLADSPGPANPHGQS
jgi:ligand-binding sensor protein